ncbi:MAG TPA: ABC transporter ATP-binding protein [Vicinamibacterales bacterium]|nr:ABC transporter ATP-binding protein [Vicinamibacterales bacterium]
MSSEMGDVVITTRNLGKEYEIGRERAVNRSLRERITGHASGIGRRLAGRRMSATRSRVWALRELDLDLRAGEVLGIIGANGAGKSTLLKILSRITHPTEGRAEIRGRVGALLEVGTGFHPELSGRENVFLNGAILGMSRAEVARKFDDIVAFAEVATFIDTPVKHYSSGMYVRLAFAVAAHLETEVLVVDEVLAVGDLRFQKKCMGQIDAVARSGRTVLLVSHNMDAVQRLCTRGILIEGGRLAADGTIQDVVRTYRARVTETNPLGTFRTEGRRHSSWAEFRDVRIVSDGHRVTAVAPEDDLTFEMDIAVKPGVPGPESLRGLVVELVIHTDDGQPLMSLMNVDHEALELSGVQACTVRATLAGPTLIPGRYRLNLFLGWPYLSHVDEIADALEFEITSPNHPWRPYPLHPSRGTVCRVAQWECRS